jgi:hypothetical protein
MINRRFETVGISPEIVIGHRSFLTFYAQNGAANG